MGRTHKNMRVGLIALKNYKLIRFPKQIAYHAHHADT